MAKKSYEIIEVTDLNGYTVGYYVRTLRKFLLFFEYTSYYRENSSDRKLFKHKSDAYQFITNKLGKNITQFEKVIETI